MIKRISLWASPRNISTAIMYSFAQRSDCKVVDEPLYGYYLANSNAKEYHPGAEQILATMETNGKKVIDHLLTDEEQPILFLKNMSHHLLDIDKGFLSAFENIILTRNPKEMIGSFSKVIDKPTSKDLGYVDQVQLLRYLLKQNIQPMVVDATTFLQNPKKNLQELCKTIEIPFEEKMLTWQAGPIKEDGVWAKYWYGNVHQSTGFLPYKKKEVELPESMQELLEDCERCYRELLNYKMVI